MGDCAAALTSITPHPKHAWPGSRSVAARRGDTVRFSFKLQYVGEQQQARASD